MLPDLHNMRPVVSCRHNIMASSRGRRVETPKMPSACRDQSRLVPTVDQFPRDHGHGRRGRAPRRRLGRSLGRSMAPRHVRADLLAAIRCRRLLHGHPPRRRQSSPVPASGGDQRATTIMQAQQEDSRSSSNRRQSLPWTTQTGPGVRSGHNSPHLYDLSQACRQG